MFVMLFSFLWFMSTIPKVELVVKLVVTPVSITVRLAQALRFVTSYFATADSFYVQTFFIMFFTASVAQEYFWSSLSPCP